MAAVKKSGSTAAVLPRGRTGSRQSTFTKNRGRTGTRQSTFGKIPGGQAAGSQFFEKSRQDRQPAVNFY